MKLTTLITLLILTVSQVLLAQTLDIEKTFEVSKEAMKGFIHTVENDEAKQQLSFIYRVRGKKNQAKFITYTFDYDFNLLNQSEETVDLTNGVPSKYKPKKYKGEAYSVEGLYVDPNMLGTLTLKRKVTSFNWNWLRMAYSWNTSVEGKLKAKTDDDQKLFYHTHLENLNDGTAMILAGEKGSPKKDPFKHMMSYHFLKYDINLTKLADVTVNFETPQAVVATYGYPLGADDDKTDMIVVFAPFKAKGYAGPKVWSKTATDYTYVRVSYDGKIIDKASFESPGSVWRVDDFVMAKDGAVYFYGPANNDKDDFFNNRLEIGDDKKKWPAFQLAKFKNGKMEFVSTTSMDEFKARLKAQPDGKKGDSYSGRRIDVTNAVVTPTSEVILAGQNYGMSRNGKGQIIGREYEDLVMFHFDATGKLISQYTMNKKNKGTEPDYQFFEFTADGKTMYWTYFDNVGTRPVRELDLMIEKPLGVPKMAKINLTSGAFDKYTEFGNGENFAHYNTLNYMKFENTNKVSFLGENKKGSMLWFARTALDK
jgi:hypothetical protein